MWHTGQPGTHRPVRFKVYAPDGETSHLVGWLHLHYEEPPNERCRMALTKIGGDTVILNGLCVVRDEEADVIAYNPKNPPTLPEFADQKLSLLTEKQQEWWKRNPGWPKMLELDWDKKAEDSGWGDYLEPSTGE
jgi:hypothetical protein